MAPAVFFDLAARPGRRAILASTLVLPLCGFTTFERLFAPSAEPWPRWERHDSGNRTALDFSAWDTLLKRYLRAGDDGVNRVDYRAFARNDAQTLTGNINELVSLPISRYARMQQLAYWINLYNAVTVKLVLDHYPVASIRDIDISPGLFADGPWDRKVVTVDGTALSLNDIEHRILRPGWRDPRLHYAVNCASIGCPNLALDAYVGDRIETMLDAAARAYINDPRGISIEGGRVIVSKIYDWFQEDFGGSTKTLLAHLKRYAEPGLAARLDEIADIHATRYDWNLNDIYPAE